MIRNTRSLQDIAGILILINCGVLTSLALCRLTLTGLRLLASSILEPSHACMMQQQKEDVFGSNLSFFNDGSTTRKNFPSVL